MADTNTVIVHFVSNAGSGKRGFKIEFSTARRVGRYLRMYNVLLLSLLIIIKIIIIIIIIFFISRG